MFCRNCGKEIQQDWMVCPNCGTKILTTSVTQTKSSYNFERIKYRSFWKYILLSLLTFGIYGICFLYGYVKDINKICVGDGKKSPNYIVVLLLCFLTFGIYGFYWWYVQGDRLYNAALKYHVTIREQGSSILLWLLLGITIMPGIGMLVAMYIMFDNMNAIAKVYNGDVSGNDLQNMNQPHPHLVRNVLIVLAINIGLFAFMAANVIIHNKSLEKESIPKYKNEIIDEPTETDSNSITDSADVLDAFIQLDRFLISSEEGIGDMYVTVHYGNDSHIVKEIVYETFISKEYYTADKVDPGNISLSDFSEFSEIYLGTPSMSVQDIGNYYLLTADYTNLDDPDRLNEFIIAGTFVLEDETEENPNYIDADYFMSDLESNGCVHGYYAEKEYSSYFGSGRDENLNHEAPQEEYIFPNSDKQYLSEDEVRSTSAENLFIGRNEIFARHGYIFKDEGLRAHFGSTSWYEGTVPGEQFSNDVFNDFEKKNIELIKKVEDSINEINQ